MWKIGDIVVCKTFPKMVNNITIGKSYEIIEIADEYPKLDLQILQIMGEKGPAWYWSDYFYSKSELRKHKLEKIWKK